MFSARNHQSLWIALREILKKDELFANKFQLKLIGKVDYSVLDSIKKYHLESYLNHIPYLSHDLVIKQQMKSHLLLLMVNNTPNAKGIITGKVFEYMASSRPTLVIGPEDGDVSKIVQNCNAGITCGFNDISKIKKQILDVFYNKINYTPSIDQYSREELTMKLSNLLNSIS